ncbi:MAG: ArsR family transcriptional regulator [Candidatus Lokiarchaeota archaeon]|nr:ArsR family transcriptional regulator [Candidatus Lokiarchaeota archaeon]MBD3339810.1 ArsR family transcriptional regulator [Candidatus Lokiarchaeota archaeon]
MPQKEKKSSDMRKKLNNLMDELERSIKVMEILDSVPRIRIALLLLIYQKLSLAQLSSLLSRSKATVTHHLKKFEDLGLLNVTRKDARGSIDAKVYEFSSNFFKSIRLSMDDLKSLKPEEAKNLFKTAIQKDQLIFELIKNIYDISDDFYQGVRRLLDSNSLENVQKKYFKSPINYQFWFLDKEGYESYEKLIEEFNDKMREIVKKSSHKKPEEIERPYLIFHSFLPLKHIIKYDFQNKRFLKFLGVFD